MVLFSNTIPDLEIQMSNEPVACVFTGEYMKFYKIAQKGNYFIINQRNTRGIYTVKGRGWNCGKTKVYFYYVEETNPIDPILTSELNKWIKTNELTTIKYKDIQHGSRLRVLDKIKSIGRPIEKIQQEESAKLENMDKEITEGVAKINTLEKQVKEERDIDISIAPIKKSYMLLEHLLNTKQINDIEHEKLSVKLENHELDFNALINELREAHVIRVYEPLDAKVESYINDLGAQNARELAGFVQDLRNNKKGLADMTAKPVTAFLSAGVILSAGIVALLAIVLLPQMLGGSHGGFNFNPMSMFGGGQGAKFLLGLIQHLPASFIDWLI